MDVGLRRSPEGTGQDQISLVPAIHPDSSAARLDRSWPRRLSGRCTCLNTKNYRLVCKSLGRGGQPAPVFTPITQGSLGPTAGNTPLNERQNILYKLSLISGATSFVVFELEWATLRQLSLFNVIISITISSDLIGRQPYDQIILTGTLACNRKVVFGPLAELMKNLSWIPNLILHNNPWKL